MPGAGAARGCGDKPALAAENETDPPPALSPLPPKKEGGLRAGMAASLGFGAGGGERLRLDGGEKALTPRTLEEVIVDRTRTSPVPR